MGLVVSLAILVMVPCRLIGAMAERRLCSRRRGRSPREDDFRRLGLPLNSDAMSWMMLERLRIVKASGGISVACGSTDGGICRESLCVVEHEAGRASLCFVVGAVIVTPEDPMTSIIGDGFGVSNG